MELVSGKTTIEKPKKQVEEKKFFGFVQPELDLVVTSNIKKTIRFLTKDEKEWFHTSATTIKKLNEIVAVKIFNAIEKAKLDGRKTVMAKDFE